MRCLQLTMFFFCSVNVKSLISFKEELSLEMCVLSDMDEEVIQMLGSSIILIYIILCMSVNSHSKAAFSLMLFHSKRMTRMTTLN